MQSVTNAHGISTETALATFIECIELTGGIVRLRDGYTEVPAADLGWPDLAQSYVKACAATGRKPMLRKATAQENEDAP